jgi:hypothetical protein
VWSLTVHGRDGELLLERVDDAEFGWTAVGPGGEGVGTLAEVLPAAAGSEADPEWIAAAIAAIERSLQVTHTQRSQLLVIRATGTWFHTTFSNNRESIVRHGLDWRRMAGPGIAGNPEPEWDGVFLCEDLEGAEWFAGMGRGRRVDIWAVELNGVWLEGDPGASGGGGDYWMICPQPISPRQLRLVAKDLSRTC